MGYWLDDDNIGSIWDTGLIMLIQCHMGYWLDDDNVGIIWDTGINPSITCNTGLTIAILLSHVALA